jgi:hypothetical protein
MNDFESKLLGELDRLRLQIQDDFEDGVYDLYTGDAVTSVLAEVPLRAAMAQVKRQMAVGKVQLEAARSMIAGLLLACRLDELRAEACVTAVEELKAESAAERANFVPSVKPKKRGA